MPTENVQYWLFKNHTVKIGDHFCVYKQKPVRCETPHGAEFVMASGLVVKIAPNDRGEPPVYCGSDVNGDSIMVRALIRSDTK